MVRRIRSRFTDEGLHSFLESHPRQWVDCSAPAYKGAYPGMSPSPRRLFPRGAREETEKRSRGGTGRLYVGWA
jgi:hypothetical protein